MSKVMFSGVSLSDHREVGCDHFPWYIGPQRTGPFLALSPDMGPHWTGPPPTSRSPIHKWHLVAITGDLFKLVHFDPLPVLTSGGHQSTYRWQVAELVRILLECFLADVIFLAEAWDEDVKVYVVLFHKRIRYYLITACSGNETRL